MRRGEATEARPVKRPVAEICTFAAEGRALVRLTSLCLLSPDTAACRPPYWFGTRCGACIVALAGGATAQSLAAGALQLLARVMCGLRVHTGACLGEGGAVGGTGADIGAVRCACGTLHAHIWRGACSRHQMYSKGGCGICDTHASCRTSAVYLVAALSRWASRRP